jgi:hypothetical protein
LTIATKASPKFGLAGYLSAALVLLGLLTLRQARSEHFTHGAELAWVYAYLTPLYLGLSALGLSGIHLLRGRVRSPTAWVPVLGALSLVAWLIAYLYFGAFRSA